MIRLIGFILGAVIAVIVLTNVVDAPIGNVIREAADRFRQQGIWQAYVKRPGQETPVPSRERTDAAPKTPSANIQNMGLATQTPPQTETTSTPSAAQPDPVSGSAAQTSASTQSWHAVWSHMAASGFAKRLALLTDREYRVTRLSVGAYQVEVGYDPDSGVADTLNQIGMMTGLSIREIQQ